MANLTQLDARGTQFSAFTASAENDAQHPSKSECRVTNIIESAVDIARRKFTDAEQKNEHASAALIEVLATTKAIIDETKKRLPDTEAADLLAKLLTEEEVKNVRQNASDYAKRLVDDFNAARDEMHTRFIKAIAAEQNAD